MTESNICSIPANKLVQSAVCLAKHKEDELALTLLEAVLRDNPLNKPARILREKIQQKYLSKIQPNSKYYIDKDYHSGLFEILDEKDERIAIFDTEYEAKEYLKKTGIESPLSVGYLPPMLRYCRIWGRM